MDFQLQVAAIQQQITVVGKGAQLANSDPFYRQLRALTPGVTMKVEDFTLKFDVATFHFAHGTITFLAPVHGRATGAVFIGQGHFHLTPLTAIDSRELMRRARAESVDEDFSEIVFRYVGPVSQMILQAGRGQTDTPPAVSAVLTHLAEKVRQRHEPPASFTDSLFNGDEMDNIDAEVLAYLYNAARPTFFSAYMHGAPLKDLRFYSRARGGIISQLGSPEEVALVNYDPGGMDDGIWYMAHAAQEISGGTASSQEERRFVAAKKFTIETVIGNNAHLTSVANIQFSPLIPGEQMVRFGLLPNLRVTRVTGSDGKELSFIQENKKADAAFYVILPAAMEMNTDYSVTVEYSGDNVVFDAGSGSFYVRARESWYPSLNDFSDRALYDLTFKVPKKYKVISVGKLDKEWSEGNFSASHWTTPKPIAVAGFNYGDYQKLEITDDITHYRITGYYLPELPDSLRRYRDTALSGMAPSAMTKYALEQTRAQMELCTHYFGRTDFNEINITEQPDFNFGQSWPNLVYLPIAAYFDETQRWLLLGHISNGLTAFVQEVTPHEVAHQWWGHAVGWASYHDQWLSEGFAEFSAGLFLQQAVGPKWQKDYIQFWDRLRKEILEKNQFGVAPNDAGPLWMGERLMSPRTMDAYQKVTYPKGAYILAMLRSIMYTNQDKDKAFIDMMHDFVESHRTTPASTESFKAIVEKHMTGMIDFDRNGRLDWFFREWVYGTQVPRYQFQYTLAPDANGKTKLHMSLTQSEVDERFSMLVPVFGDFGKGMVRLGQLPITGNTTKTFDIDIPVEPKKVVLNAYKEILER